ncbi:MAG: hypothetical protein ABFD13_04250 [Candidatus Cryosericum sp.]
MEEWSWGALVELPASQALPKPDTTDVSESCPCSCLRTMVCVVDAGTIRRAVLQAQVALGAISGKVVLSVYRRAANENRLELVATGHDPGNALDCISLEVPSSSMLEAVLADGKIRWVTVEKGDVSLVGIAALHDHGEISGLLVAEFLRGEAAIGKPSALCLQCMASVLSVVTIRVAVDEAQDDLLLLSRYRIVAELSAQVAHDLNNMMQGVLGNAEIAKLEVPEAGSINECLTAIEEAATRASVLARKLLSFARDTAKGRETCNAVKAASDAIDLAGTLYLKDVDVIRNLPAKPIPVRMTDNELENVLLLLIKSSVLQLKPVTGAELNLEDHPEKIHVAIQLAIHGISQAISSEDRIEAASLTSAARAVAARRQASCEMMSKPGHITISLVVEKDATQEPGSDIKSIRPAEQPSLKGVRVLVIGKPSAVPMLLGAAGCLTETALTWEEGARHVAEFAPRVIVAAVSNKADLDAAVEGRRRLHLPVIIISQGGVSLPAEKVSLIDGVLGSPLDLGDLRSALARVLG